MQVVLELLFGHTPLYISDLLASVADVYLLDLHCVLRQATSSCSGRVDESTTGLSLSPHRTASMEQAADTAGAAVIAMDYFFSPTVPNLMVACIRRSFARGK